MNSIIEDGGYKAKMVLDSISPDGIRLSTMEITFPRFVLAEFNTHKILVKNSASSRALPIEKQLKKVIENPVIPVQWGKNQKGMQAEEELNEEEKAEAIKLWLTARDKAVEQATLLMKANVHKQITNRILEPFMWHTVIVSATEWMNFFGLRCHKDAQPEIRKIAIMMYRLYTQCKPISRNYGDWHLPLVIGYDNKFINEEDREDAFKLSQELKIPYIEVLKKASAGRCCRVSYLTHNGKRDLMADIELCDKLIDSGHYSPLEHLARPMESSDLDLRLTSLSIKDSFKANFRGWIQYRKSIQNEDDFSKKFAIDTDSFPLLNN